MLFLTFDTHIHTHSIYFGMATLSSFLKKCGFPVDWLHIPRDWPADKAAAEVKAREPELVGASMMTSDWLRARELLPAIRVAVPDAMIVAGGIHPTFRPDDVISHTAIDAVCVGEGEYPLLELLQRLQAGEPYLDIENFWFKSEGRLIKNKIRPAIEDLDTLPWPDHEMFREWQSGIVQVLTGRGCPFKCTFCAVPAFHQMYKNNGNFLRRRSVRNVIDEVKHIMSIMPVHHFQFIDDVFTIPRKWALEFAEVYGREVRVPFTIITRVDTVDAEVLDALRAANLEVVSFGVESGSARLRKIVLRRKMTNETIIKAFQLCHERGIQTNANYIVGFPGETREDILATMQLHRQLKPGNITVWYFYPYPATPLEKTCREENLLPENFDSEPVSHFKPMLRLPDLPGDELLQLHDEFVYGWTDEVLERVRSMREMVGIKAPEEDLARIRSSVLEFYRLDADELQQRPRPRWAAMPEM